MANGRRSAEHSSESAAGAHPSAELLLQKLEGKSKDLTDFTRTENSFIMPSLGQCRPGRLLQSCYISTAC